MGMLLRGTQQNFNPQIWTESNSLTVKMSKHFEVRKKALQLFNKYSKFTSFMFLTDRVNGGARSGKVKTQKSIKDNAYRIQYEGADVLPAYSFGSVQIGSVFQPGVSNPDMTSIVGVTYTNGLDANSVATDTPITFAVKHDPDNDIYGDKFNPNDSITLDNGLGIMVVITSQPRLSSTGDHYVIDGKTVGPAALFSEAFFAEGVVLGESGNYFGEGSLRGYQRSSRNKWRINYSSIHRYTLTMTGSAMSQKITPIINQENGSQMWEYTEVLKAEKYFHKANELALRYSRTSMDVSSHKWYENFGRNNLTLTGFKMESGMTAPIMGDGWIPQIQDNATFTYNPNDGLSYLMVQAIMNVLAQRSPSSTTGNTFVFVTDRIGAMVLDESFKKLIGWGNPAVSTSAVANETVASALRGNENELGFTVNKYNFMNNKMIVIEDDLLNDPSNNPVNGGMVGTGNIYILNATPVDGVSNMEVISKSGRDYTKAYIDGLFSLRPGGGSAMATSGFDGARVDMLCELMPVLYDAKSCGILKASEGYNGGALAGSSFLADNNTAASFIF